MPRPTKRSTCKHGTTHCSTKRFVRIIQGGGGCTYVLYVCTMYYICTVNCMYIREKCLYKTTIMPFPINKFVDTWDLYVCMYVCNMYVYG